MSKIYKEPGWIVCMDCNETHRESTNRYELIEYMANAKLKSEDGIARCRCGGFLIYENPISYIKCDCGLTVYLHGFTNTCECGADYNLSGQRLASRSQWGEETGESLSDILSVDIHNPPIEDW